MEQCSRANILKLYDKIKHLCKECNVDTQSIKKQFSVDKIIGMSILCIEQIIKTIISYRTQSLQQNSIQDQYQKLEKYVQKYQNDIRKHLALQQQLKLYNDALLQKLQETQNAQIQIVNKSRMMISDIKKENLKLSEQNKILKDQKQRIHFKRKKLMTQIDLTKHNKEISYKQFHQSGKETSKKKKNSSQFLNQNFFRSDLDLKTLFKKDQTLDRKKQFHKKIMRFMGDKRSINKSNTNQQTINYDTNGKNDYRRRRECKKGSVFQKYIQVQNNEARHLHNVSL